MEKSYTILTSDLVALGHILDYFEEFDKEFREAYSKGFFFGLRPFYKRNKEVVDIINNYSDIKTFLNKTNYDFDNEGKLCLREGMKFFYQYFLSHRDSMDQMLGVLEKINELGFSYIDFNSDADFTKEEFNISSFFGQNIEISFFDNIEVIPSCSNGIHYRTKSSNYRMDLNVGFSDVLAIGSQITLNSLLFDPERLPDNLTKESTFGKLVELKKEQTDVTSYIRDSVCLGDSIQDLDKQILATIRTVNGLENAENKQQLLETLLNIKANAIKLQSLSAEYDRFIMGKDPLITPEVLETEKKVYAKRRKRIDIDCC